MPRPRRVVLASQSPRRRELLEQIGIEAVVRPAEMDESSIRYADPERLARALAEAKASIVRDRIASGEEAALPVIGADTIVTIGGHILEKPADEADARRMMRLLRGEEHQVITGVAIVAPDADTTTGARTIDSAVTKVKLAAFSEAELDDYIASGEWNGVAGAYRIQGVAARYVEHLEGSYSNVVGLPLHLVYTILTWQLG